MYIQILQRLFLLLISILPHPTPWFNNGTSHFFRSSLSLTHLTRSLREVGTYYFSTRGNFYVISINLVMISPQFPPYTCVHLIQTTGILFLITNIHIQVYWTKRCWFQSISSWICYFLQGENHTKNINS